MAFLDLTNSYKTSLMQSQASGNNRVPSGEEEINRLLQYYLKLSESPDLPEEKKYEVETIIKTLRQQKELMGKNHSFGIDNLEDSNNDSSNNDRKSIKNKTNITSNSHVDIKIATEKAKKVQEEATKLSEIGNGIFSQIANFGGDLTNRFEINTKSEWEYLGNFLNNPGGNYDINGYTINDLSEDDRKILQKMYDEMKNKFLNEYDISNINDILYKNYYNYKKSSFNEAFANINTYNIRELSYDAISCIYNNDNRSDKEILESHEILKNIILEKAKELGIEDNENIQLLNSSVNLEDLCVATKKALSAIRYADNQKSFEDEFAKIKARRNSSEDSRCELHKYAEEYFVEMEGDTFGGNNEPVSINFGKGRGTANGKIGEAGLNEQKTGNCWLMAGINSLNDDSDGLIDNNLFRDSVHGVTVVRIPEAANNHCGKDGKGIYFVTDKELYRSVNVSDGDYDVAAYNIAVQKYFDEKQSGSQFSGESLGSIYGNTNERFFELATGQKSKEFKGDNIPEGVGNTTEPTFDSIYELIENNGKCVLGIKFDLTKPNSQHAISVVGTKNGKIIVQESNNSERFAKEISPDSWQDENGRWYIPMDKETFEKRVYSAGTYKK